MINPRCGFYILLNGVTNKPGPKSKTKPGPKSKTRTKVIKLDDSMEENDGIPDLDLFVSDD